MGKDSFSFKEFSIQQNACGMKVSQDACLFGAWASFTPSARLLDIGAGTGLLSLMLAQRYPKTRIDAVEFDEAAYEQARLNIKNSPWARRISPFRGKVQEFTAPYAYDGIICNPPFFPDHLQAREAGRNLARHTQSLSYQELCQAIFRLLSEEGKACLMLPYTQTDVFLKAAAEAGLSLSERLDVQPKPGKPPHRSFFCLQKHSVECLKKASFCVADTHGHYTDAFKALLQAFYLAL